MKKITKPQFYQVLGLLLTARNYYEKAYKLDNQMHEIIEEENCSHLADFLYDIDEEITDKRVNEILNLMNIEVEE